MVSAGAKILGSFTIGENSKIGAGSVVLKEVPPNCTVVGVPGRIVKRNDVKVPRSDMNQVDLPDPVMECLTKLQQENDMLRAQVLELEGNSCGGNISKARCMERKTRWKPCVISKMGNACSVKRE